MEQFLLVFIWLLLQGLLAALYSPFFKDDLFKLITLPRAHFLKFVLVHDIFDIHLLLEAILSEADRFPHLENFLISFEVHIAQ